jgi:hypothetical protein
MRRPYHSNCDARYSDTIASPIQSTDLSLPNPFDRFLATSSPAHESSFSVRLRKNPSAASSANKQANTVNIGTDTVGWRGDGWQLAVCKQGYALAACAASRGPWAASGRHSRALSRRSPVKTRPGTERAQGRCVAAARTPGGPR